VVFCNVPPGSLGILVFVAVFLVPLAVQFVPFVGFLSSGTRELPVFGTRGGALVGDGSGFFPGCDILRRMGSYWSPMSFLVFVPVFLGFLLPGFVFVTRRFGDFCYSMFSFFFFLVFQDF